MHHEYPHGVREVNPAAEHAKVLPMSDDVTKCTRPDGVLEAHAVGSALLHEVSGTRIESGKIILSSEQCRAPVFVSSME